MFLLCHIAITIQFIPISWVSRAVPTLSRSSKALSPSLAPGTDITCPDLAKFGGRIFGTVGNWGQQMVALICPAAGLFRFAWWPRFLKPSLLSGVRNELLRRPKLSR